MPSCLPVEIIYAKLTVTTIFPDWAGPTGGPARAEILTAAAPRGRAGAWAGACGRAACGRENGTTTSTSRPINSPEPSPLGEGINTHINREIKSNLEMIH